MEFVSLNKTYKVKSKSHGVVELPENTLEVPQVGSLREAVEFAGSEEALVEQYNDAIKGTAKNGAIAIVRNAAEGTDILEAIKKAVNYARNFTFTRITKKSVLEGVDKIKEAAERGDLAKMSTEELLALMQSTIGISVQR